MTTGAELLVEILHSQGVTHVFGNPGTTELPLIDALSRPGCPKYVLGLQEATVVAMADGYAQATGRPAFVNLHTVAGLGNGMGALTNARANRSALVVTAGNQDQRHLVLEPLLAGDLVRLAAPVSRWSMEVRRPDDLPVILSRAFLDAATPPRGPVFVSLPMDVLTTDTSAKPQTGTDRSADLAPTPELLHAIIDRLAASEPGAIAVIAGDEVRRQGAIDLVVQLADALDASVFAPPLPGRMSFLPDHPRWGGSLPPAATAIRRALAPFEIVICLGADPFLLFPYTDGPPLPDAVEVVHVSEEAEQLGRIVPANIALAADISAVLRALVPLVQQRFGRGIAAVPSRVAERAARRAVRPVPEASPGIRPRTADVVRSLMTDLPDPCAVVDEAATANRHVLELLACNPGVDYFFCRGGGLGWGMPASVGISLARPGTPVLCIVGDGALSYSPQALWTAAHLRLPIVYAVIDNGQYRVLRDFLTRDHGEQRAAGAVGLDLQAPPIDHVGLARAYGVASSEASDLAEGRELLAEAQRANAPHLVHIAVA